jgi:hypothetical protein
MLEILLGGGCLSIPLLFVPVEWAKNPKVQPWVERLIIGTVAICCLHLFIG